MSNIKLATIFLIIWLIVCMYGEKVLTLHAKYLILNFLLI